MTGRENFAPFLLVIASGFASLQACYLFFESFPLINPPAISLHIGAHKTATTHLQRSLQKHEQALHKRNVRFYGPRYLRDPEHRLAEVFGLNDGGDSTLSGAEQARLLAQGAERLILSEENLLGLVLSDYKPGLLYPRAKLRVARLLDRLETLPVSLFLSVRDPAPWIASLYAQRIKGGHLIGFSEFCAGSAPDDLEWSHLVKRLSNLPNLSEVVVWRYEEYKALFPSIVKSLSGQSEDSPVKPIKRRLNTSLSAAALKQIETWRTEKKGGQLKSWAKEANAMFPMSDGYPPFAPWSDAELEASRLAYLKDWDVIKSLPGVTALEV